MKTISISNQKGGCGKTTTAINLSSALASMGRRILLIDLDPQAHASFGLGITSQLVDKSIYSVLTDNSERRRPITECILTVSENLDIVPSNILLSTLEQELKDKEDAVSKLHAVLTGAGLNYDYAIVDCPPSLGFLTFNALRAADVVVVPIDMGAFSLMGVSKLLGMLELIKVKIGHSPAIGALATIFDRRTKYSQTMLDTITTFFKDQMLKTVIRMNVALKKAASKGMSVIEFDRKSNGANDHLALAEEILRMTGAMEFEKSVVRTPEPKEVLAMVEAVVDAALNAAAESIKLPAQAAEPQAELPKPMETLAREITFLLKAPQAREVYLVGDFNKWEPSDNHRLSRLDDGKWEKRLGLLPGRYKYKFLVDGEWVADSQNGERVQNSFGTFDSVLSI